MLLRFVEGRPVSNVTTAFLSWIVEQETLQGCRVLVLFWDNASWHKSKEVQTWLRAYNRQAKAQNKVRLLICPLPKKSPWLNAIEPKWVLGKRAVCEARKVLSSDELQKRLYRYYRAKEQPQLKQKLA
jgi:transposase